MIRVAIIGGGLAGTACAYVLKCLGAEPVIYESGPALAPGASGNPLGLYNPRLSAERSAGGDYFSSAFSLAVRIFSELNDIGWNKCGSLHLMTDEKRQKRFPQTVRNWGWDPSHMRIVNTEEASRIAGIEIRHEALYLPDAGFVSPLKLCRACAQDVPVRFNQKIESLAGIDADAVILACGADIKNFTETKDLPLRLVRGQITQMRATDKSAGLRCNLNYGGYISPAAGGIHTLGATFQRWLDHTDISEQDDRDNMSALAKAVPALAGDFEITGHRAALRVSSPDYLPVAGRVPGHENLYISAGHGSHGIIGSLAAAHLLAAMILDRPLPLARGTVQKLDPARFSA